MVVAELLTRQATILLFDNAGHKQKVLAVSIQKVKIMLEFNAALYPIERDWKLFVKQYLIGDTATLVDQFGAAHPEADNTWAAMKELLVSQVASTKHHTAAAFQKLCLAR